MAWPAAASELGVRFEHGLYLGGVEDVVHGVAGLAEGVGTVLVLGHNPGWEEALAWVEQRKAK